ncbi:dihydrofolate reductase family protein [Actinotalea sp. M2MS4P-6]|uniref:dihydrofolate reductase family protein n=1 Tax=Actinotalea sp. M2MS4P-6 TaxID=2983762 RepID=UPI0021E48AB8|nr:dihydrofolate reductase family protein [Actinotalea sp. M2MS4P-6]MCV2393719.1 dihydrofolate reductase family protein [Actinotalea sp. M2MS4P-6]
MGRLRYAALTSLDGYVADPAGHFDFAMPNEAVHRAANDIEREVGTAVYGRRMFEIMRYWAAQPEPGETSEAVREFAEIWHETDKLVVSRSLPQEEADLPRTTLLRELSPAAMVQLARDSAKDLSVGGPTLAAAVLRAGAVDDLHQFVFPVVVGGGLPWLPRDVPMKLELASATELEGGVVHLHYRTL